MRFTWETRKHHYTADVDIDFKCWALPLSIGFGHPRPLEIPTMMLMIGPMMITVEKRIKVVSGA